MLPSVTVMSRHVSDATRSFQSNSTEARYILFLFTLYILPRLLGWIFIEYEFTRAQPSCLTAPTCESKFIYRHLHHYVIYHQIQTISSTLSELINLIRYLRQLISSSPFSPATSRVAIFAQNYFTKSFFYMAVIRRVENCRFEWII